MTGETSQGWHLNRLKSHNYETRRKFENQKKKPYVCKFCKWRTDSLEKINKHVEKFNSIFVHGIPNPHKAIHLSYKLNDKELMSHWRHDLRLNEIGVICKSCEIVLEFR